MRTAGIICEYNPFHNGHQHQLEAVRQRLGPDTALVCVMSGNYVQRGEPAMFDRLLRARAAVDCGADLVLELPLTACLDSAEGFAAAGVSILRRLGAVDTLAFGAETGTVGTLMRLADCLLSPELSPALRRQLDAGLPFPKAREKAAEELCGLGSLLQSPNDILAVEYCKAVRRTGAALEVLPLRRQGSDRDRGGWSAQSPSAEGIRRLLLHHDPAWKSCTPVPDLFASVPVHTAAAGERALLARLRMLSDGEWTQVPHGGEGLRNRVRRAVMAHSTLEGALREAACGRYPLARIRRLMLCACLGIREEDKTDEPAYVRLLALSDRGREVLHRAKKAADPLPVLHLGQRTPDPLRERLEDRANGLYDLFRTEIGEVPASGPERVYRRFEQSKEKTAEIQN